MGELDAELLRRIADRDIDALDELYRRYGRAVISLADYLGVNGCGPDVVRETFNTVWSSARSFRPEKLSCSGWLYEIARAKSLEAGADRIREVGEPPPVGPEAERAWLVWCMQSGLAQLPEDERVVLELTYWRGFTQAEIARHLGLPLETVKQRTHAGLARLADRLDDGE